MGKGKELKRIAQYLLLHGSTIPNIGLLHGKMGVCIFFFHYAKQTKNEVYQMYAEDLIDEIYSEINVNIPANFKDGLCGIAWGIGYLAENKFVKVNSDIVLKKLDESILERDVRRISDISLDTGLKGIAYYVLSRCADKDSNFSTTNSDYISDLLSALKRATPDAELTFLITNLERFITDNKSPKYDFFLKKLMKETVCPKRKIWEQQRPMGIADQGLAGIGIKFLNII